MRAREKGTRRTLICRSIASLWRNTNTAPHRTVGEGKKTKRPSTVRRSHCRSIIWKYGVICLVLLFHWVVSACVWAILWTRDTCDTQVNEYLSAPRKDIINNERAQTLSIHLNGMQMLVWILQSLSVNRFVVFIFLFSGAKLIFRNERAENARKSREWNKSKWSFTACRSLYSGV